MGRKKKFPTRWGKQWFMIELYKPIGWLRRRKFLVRATTHKTAVAKLRKLYPCAEIFCVAPIGI